MRSRRVAQMVLLAVAAAAVAAVGVGTPRQAAAQSGPNPDARVEYLAETIAANQRPSVSIARFDELVRYSPYLPRRAYLDTLEKLAERVDSPLVEYRVLREAAATRLDLHDASVGYDGMEGPLSRQGCLTQWQLVGPFDNDSMGGFRQALGPEVGADGPYSGKMREVNWRAMPEIGRFCVFHLGHTVRPSTSAVAYLAGRLSLDGAEAGAEQARLLVGASGAYKVWVNGELVAEQERDLGLAPDARAWKVPLRADGPNDILVKVASRTDSGMSWTARLVDEDMEPLDVEMEAAWSGEPVQSEASEQASEQKADGKNKKDETESDEAEASKQQAGPKPTGEGLVARVKDCASGQGPAAAWCVNLWQRVASQVAAAPWRDEAKRLLEPLRAAEDPAAVKTALGARDVLRLAEVFDEWGKRADIAELAAKLAPDAPWVTLHRARLYGASIMEMDRVRERRLLEELVDRRPEFWPATLRLADWYRGRDFPRKALKLVEGLEIEKADQRPRYLRDLVSLQRQAGSREAAEQTEQALYAVTAMTSNWPSDRVSELAAAGEVERALKLVEKQRKLHPSSRHWGIRQANLMRAAGHQKKALAVVEELIDQRPGDVQLRRRRAEMLVAMDRRDEAVATLEKAVELRPQNKGLRDFLSFLRPRENRFHEPWMIEEPRELADAREPGSFSQDTIVDQTVVHVAPNGLYQKVVQRVDRVITAEGIDGARGMSVSYQAGDEQVDVLQVRVHKADGTVLEDYDQWETRSRSGGSYYTDRKYVNLRANNVEAGDLVEFRYRVRQVANENFRGDYFGDVSFVQDTQPVAFARYVVQSPETWELYFREPALEHEKLTDELPGGEAPRKGFGIDGFELSGVPAVQTDPRQPGYTDVYDYILVSNKKTWEEVGEWWWNLVEEQLIASDEIKAKVAELVDGLETDRQKLQAIHNWVVKNTRYLHVGLGIHGWKPYKTTSCFNNKYGDCKDKASLMKVMLEEAGIETNLVLVRTRRLGHVEKFPPSMHIFNHAIDYVPSMDLYLDPTAEFNGTTELTPMDQGAQALIVKDGGATTFTTLPVDEPDDNKLGQTLKVRLDGKNKTVTEGRIEARGQNAVYYRQSLEDPERRDEEFEKQLAKTYPGAQLVSASYKNLNALEKPVIIEFSFKGGRIERSAGGGAFVFPYGAPRDLLGRYAEQSSRNQDLKIRVPYANETTVRYTLPTNRGFERVPDDVRLTSEFGELRIDYRRVGASDEKVEAGEGTQGDESDESDEAGQTLVVDIRYSIAVQRVPVEKYDEFRTFLSEATSALGTTIPISDEK